MALRYTTERLETVSDHDNWGVKVVPLLTQIFELMDENQDGSVDEVEGALIGMAMGESEERAQKSFVAMCQDMDDDANTSIEIEEWLSFYEKSLKDAVLSDVMEQLEKMHEAVAKQKELRAETIEAQMLAAEEAGEELDEEGELPPDIDSPLSPDIFDQEPSDVDLVTG